MGASGILLETLTSFRVRTPPSGELPGGLPLLHWELGSKRGKTPGKGYASGVDASGILLKTLSSLEPRTPRSGDLPGVLPLIQRGHG